MLRCGHRPQSNSMLFFKSKLKIVTVKHKLRLAAPSFVFLMLKFVKLFKLEMEFILNVTSNRHHANNY